MIVDRWPEPHRHDGKCVVAGAAIHVFGCSTSKFVDGRPPSLCENSLADFWWRTRFFRPANRRTIDSRPFPQQQVGEKISPPCCGKRVFTQSAPPATTRVCMVERARPMERDEQCMGRDLRAAALVPGVAP